VQFSLRCTGCNITPMDTTTLVLIGGLFVLTAASLLWLCFMLWQPARWATFVDWEYDFWVRRGLISPSLAEKCKRLEKGLVLKCLVAVTAILGTVFLLVTGLVLLRS
jgi:hypothetical protein